MKKDKVDEALEKMAESLRRLEKNGDIDSFVVIAQRKTSRTTDGMTAICVANERYLMTWAAALARAVAHRGHHSPKRVAQDLYNIITSWSQYEKEHEVEAWGMSKMTEYIDKRGWKFRVMHGLGDVWKARYNKPGARSWKCVAVLPWRWNREDAEDDLEVYAEAHGMKKAEE